jgi:hypothetical protein
MARKWIENNFRNRPMREDDIRAYARDMATGNWFTTHQGIAFDENDNLIDGQHRLRAIILSGVTVRMMVTFGLPSKIDGKEITTMDSVDRGRPRSVADQLTIQHEIKGGAAIAAVCASLGSICYGERTRRLSVGHTLTIYRAFEGAVTWVIAHRSKEHGLKSAGVLAAFAFALATEDGFAAGNTPIAQMHERLMVGRGLKPSSPIGQLRRFLTSDDAKLLTRGTDRGLAELVLYAIFLERKGRAIPKLGPDLAGVDYFRAAQKGRVATIAALFRLPATAS